MREADNWASREFARFFSGMEPDPSGWIGLGLEGGLAQAVFDGQGKLVPGQLGDPVPIMVERLRHWLGKGLVIKLFTPLAAREEGVAKVKDWLRHHGLPDLPVTHAKDLHMLELWDARCIQVIPNTGRPVGQSRLFADAKKTEPEKDTKDVGS